MIGAATPIVACPGSMPTSAVATPMITIVIRNVCLRPDKVAEPSEDDRAERPHREARSESQQREDETVVSLTPAKNCLPMIAASDAYR